MKKVFTPIGLLLVLAWPLYAQVSLEISQPQEQFLPGEALPVAVRITNRSGQPLHLGGEEDWLTFTVESRDGIVVTKLEEVPVLGEITLESSKMATKRVNLEPYFVLGQPGRYQVKATVRLRQWQQEITSAPKTFEIITGTRLWEQEFGVPGSGSQSNLPPEVRKYILQQANYLKHELRLYVRLTDRNEAKVFKVFAVGPLLSFSRPEPQVDRMNNLHLLYQVGPRSYSYTMVNPEGEVLERHTYDYYADRPRPRLKGDEDGKISVTGGIRRVSAEDPVIAKPPPLTNAAPTNKP